MIAFEVALTLVREVLRALLAPLRLLLYLPRRRHWRMQATQALAQAAQAAPAAAPDEPILERLLARSAAGRRRIRAADRGAHGPRVFLSAGEASGDAHAANLLHELRRRLGPGLEAHAFGGPLLREAGAVIVAPLAEQAVMGLVPVLKSLPALIGAFAAFLRTLRDQRPDLVVLVDYPGLHLVMAKACRRRGIPTLHYVAPQYWAWGPWRMRRYRRSVDATLTILPFETAFFERASVPARYIGHPLLDQLAAHPADPRATAAVTARPTLCLLPGSRRSEIEANLPGMVALAARLQAQDPSARVVVAHRDARRRERIEALLRNSGSRSIEVHIGPLGPWLAGARVTLAKSGTGSLEACLHGNPVVVVYKLRSRLGSLGYRNILSVPYIAAANLIADARVVPEHCFRRDDGWREVEESVLSLWPDGPQRQRCIDGLTQVRARLGEPGASARTAALIHTFYERLAAQETRR